MEIERERGGQIDRWAGRYRHRQASRYIDR